VATTHEKILVLRGNSHDAEDLAARTEMLLAAARSYDAYTIKRLLKEIVPDYNPQLCDW
jgi:hypothetical protein